MSDPPEMLYVRGKISDAPRIAVVGSRDCSAYGRQVAYRLAADIGAASAAVCTKLVSVGASASMHNVTPRAANVSPAAA